MSLSGGESKVVNGTAFFSCVTLHRHLEEDIVTKDVSVPKIKGEPPDKTLARLEAVAKNHLPISGCFRSDLENISSPDLAGSTPPPNQSVAVNDSNNPCEDRWSSRRACKW